MDILQENTLTMDETGVVENQASDLLLAQDYRPLFKRYMGPGYFQRKAEEKRMSRQNLSNILKGRTNNVAVLEECLSELNEKIDIRTRTLQHANNLTELHKRLLSI